MKSQEITFPSKLKGTLAEAQAYVDQLAAPDPPDSDYAKLQAYISDLALYSRLSTASKALIETVGRLFFEAGRFQEAAEVLKKLKEPSINELRINIDFLNGYDNIAFPWKDRQEVIWKAFSEVEQEFVADNEDVQNRSFMSVLQTRWDHCFPNTYLMLAAPTRKAKGKVLLSNPHGIFSLVPLLYLIRHAPEAVSRHWSLLLEDEDAPGVVTAQVLGKPISADNILVRLVYGTEYGDRQMEKLEIWHPALAEMVKRGEGADALSLAVFLVGQQLPLTTLVLDIEEITLAKKAPTSGRILPMSKLLNWAAMCGLLELVSPASVFEERRLRFFRTPAEVSRPRADITKGETCMPELEQIYFLRKGEGLAIFQRYGVANWFLTIPKAVCGEDFQAFRRKLEGHVFRTSGDAVFFTGWAEGSENCYIDFLSMEGVRTLDTLEAYCKELPRGEDIRICSFYWNAVPRSLDYLGELLQFQQYEITLIPRLDRLQPPPDLTSKKDQAAMKEAFLDTMWCEMDAIVTFSDEDDEDDE